MSLHEFTKSSAWKNHKRELVWEIAAVSLPVLIYVVAGLFIALTPTEIGASATDVLRKPDSFFGASVLFFFAAIHGFSARIDGCKGTPDAEIAAERIQRHRVWGLGSGLICAVVGALTIVFHPIWAMPAGLLAMFFSIRTYWFASHTRAYVLNTIRTDR